MGLKVIGFAPPKSGKSWFGLSMAELGPIGLIDTEDRMEWYTYPYPKPLAARPFPFDNPRAVRPMSPHLAAITAPIYLVQTKEVAKTGRAIEAWSSDPGIVGIVLDSGSVVWDLLQDTRDDSNPATSMLSWTPIKKTIRRLMYAGMSGGKHLFITAHTQEKYKKVGRELVVEGTRPWLEKKMPHWADLLLEFAFPDGAPHPVVRVDGEGVGGQGGIKRGAILGDPLKGEPAETFGSLLKRLTFVAPTVADLDPDELAYRNQGTVDLVGKAPTVPEIDGEPGR